MDKSLHCSSRLKLLKEKGLTEFNYPNSRTTAMRNNQQFAMVSIFLGKCLHGANDHSSNCYRERLNDIRCSCTSRLDSDLWLRICRMGMKKCCQFLMEQHPKEPLRRYCRQRATLNKQHVSTKQDSTLCGWTLYHSIFSQNCNQRCTENSAMFISGSQTHHKRWT